MLPATERSRGIQLGTVIRDDSDATWRRIRRIPFRYGIPDDQVDKYFYERVLEPELPGILAWMVRGCLDWQRAYPTPPSEHLRCLRRPWLGVVAAPWPPARVGATQ
jgi:hypothetical protein